MKLYLDTSAWVKRYLFERGTPEIDLVFEAASSGQFNLLTSFWNVGECLGVFEKRAQRGEFGVEVLGVILRKFFSETIDRCERGELELLPISARTLLRCWKHVLNDHIYQADALQLETAQSEGCVFLTADGGLAKIAGESRPRSGLYRGRRRQKETARPT